MLPTCSIERRTKNLEIYSLSEAPVKDESIITTESSVNEESIEFTHSKSSFSKEVFEVQQSLGSCKEKANLKLKHKAVIRHIKDLNNDVTSTNTDLSKVTWNSCYL
jgi:hypothetical protein